MNPSGALQSPGAEGPADAILAAPADPTARAADEVLGAVLFDPAFSAAIDSLLKETPQ